MSKTNLIILTLSVLILTSCAIASCPPAELPTLKPVTYKKISTAEYQCVSDETYAKFRYNDVACKARIKTLNSVINKVNKGSDLR